LTHIGIIVGAQWQSTGYFAQKTMANE